MKRILPYLDDLLYWLGATLMSVGAGLVYFPAGLCAAGGFCLVYSYLTGKMLAHEQQRKLAQEGESQ